MSPVKYEVTNLGGGITQTGVSFPGGLDQTTPSLKLQPGSLVQAQNFECAQSGGYARIEGYERFDGRPAPSAATFVIVQVASFTNVPAFGTIINQDNSLATGIVAFVNNDDTGAYMIVTDVTGTFDATSNISSGYGTLTVTAANSPIIVTNELIVSTLTAIGTAITTVFAPTAQQSAQFSAFAAAARANIIQPVPGSGAVLGVVGMIFGGQDYVYAFRANGSNTAVLLYQASPGGWQLVPFFSVVNFTGGTGIVGQPSDMNTLTQGGVTATIMRVMWQSGSWAASGGTAVGTFVVTNLSGGSLAAGAATTADGATVILSGPQAQITLSPGGHFEFVKCNFAGQLATRRIYGCDGINKCFEFDGTTFAPITTGLSPDMPSHICFHNNFLFISQASSMFYCGVGTPFKWDAIDGGGEIATGDVVTAMLTLPGSQTSATLGVYLRSNTAFLYGTDPATFNYVSFNTGLGALPYSAQNLFDTFVFDDLGVVTLKTTLNWGNFLPTTLTKNILPFVEQEREKLIASAVQRSKSQYRVFFSDGFGLYLTMVNQQYLGAIPVLFPNPVFCCDEGENSAGVEVTYFGSSDGLGYVYQLDSGSGFDGQDLAAFMTLAWNPIRSPRILKRFRAASIEMQGTAYAEFQFGYQLGYGTTQIGQPTPLDLTTALSSVPFWDQFTWDQFTWDGQVLSPNDVDMTGTGENIQVNISSGTNYVDAFTVDSIIYHYSLRRGIRV